MSEEIHQRIEERSDREALRLLKEADADFRAHPLWTILGISPDELPAALERWKARARFSKERLQPLQQKLAQEIEAKVPTPRMVRGSSVEDFQFINQIKV